MRRSTLGSILGLAALLSAACADATDPVAPDAPETVTAENGRTDFYHRTAGRRLPHEQRGRPERGPGVRAGRGRLPDRGGPGGHGRRRHRRRPGKPGGAGAHRQRALAPRGEPRLGRRLLAARDPTRARPGRPGALRRRPADQRDRARRPRLRPQRRHAEQHQRAAPRPRRLVAPHLRIEPSAQRRRGGTGADRLLARRARAGRDGEGHEHDHDLHGRPSRLGVRADVHPRGGRDALRLRLRPRRDPHRLGGVRWARPTPAPCRPTACGGTARCTCSTARSRRPRPQRAGSSSRRTAATRTPRTAAAAPSRACAWASAATSSSSTTTA